MKTEILESGTVVRYIALPVKVPAVTVEDENGNYNVYINNRLSSDQQFDALQHELNHIDNGHIHSDKPVADLEKDAENYVPCVQIISEVRELAKKYEEDSGYNGELEENLRNMFINKGTKLKGIFYHGN